MDHNSVEPHEIDRLVRELLETTLVERPPIDVLVVAERLGITIAEDRALNVRARTKRLAGRTIVLVAPEERAERRQWAVAHELGEIHSWRLLDRTPECGDEREGLANQFATRLLLPEDWMREAIAEHGADLPALKQRFATASHELIAMRLLDFETPCVVTVFDNGRRVRRRSNGSVPSLHPDERTVWSRCHASGKPGSLRTESMEVRCWPIHEPNWQREIVVTMPTEWV